MLLASESPASRCPDRVLKTISTFIPRSSKDFQSQSDMFEKQYALNTYSKGVMVHIDLAF